MNQRAENIRYDIIVGCLIMLDCIGLAYADYYLSSIGVSKSIIGIILAVSCCAAFVLQSILGKVVDRNGDICAKNTLIILGVFEMAATLLGVFVGNVFVRTLVFGIFLSCLLGSVPVINSLPSFYRSYDVDVKYSVARGIGSLCYLALSVLLGFVTASYGENIVLYFALAIEIVFIVTVLSISFDSSRYIRKVKTKKVNGGFRLLSNMPFCVLLIGLSLIMIFHNMIMNYFIDIIRCVGGDASSLGVALGIGTALEIPLLFFYNKLHKKISNRMLLLFSCFCFLIKAVLLLAAGQIWMIYLIQLIHFTTYALTAVSKVHYVDELINGKEYAEGQAYMSRTEIAGMIAGSFLGGLVLEKYDARTMLWVGFAICFMGVLSVLISYKMTGEPKADNKSID